MTTKYAEVLDRFPEAKQAIEGRSSPMVGGKP